MTTDRNGDADERAGFQRDGEPLEERFLLVVVVEVPLGRDVVVLRHSASEVLQRLGQLATVQCLVAAV